MFVLQYFFFKTAPLNFSFEPLLVYTFSWKCAVAGQLVNGRYYALGRMFNRNSTWRQSPVKLARVPLPPNEAADSKGIE